MKICKVRTKLYGFGQLPLQLLASAIMRVGRKLNNLLLVLVVGFIFIMILAFWSGRRSPIQPTRAVRVPVVGSYMNLLSLSPELLAEVDIARMNLLCAQNLPGADDLDINAALGMLEQIATRVRSETERHFYRFKRDPAEYENSEGYFHMIMLAVVLAEDFQVRYATDKRGTAANARIGDGFFSNARDVFLHGLTGPKRQGTCSSLPVLQVAVGRRLGYPLKLVTTKGHLFVRWEDSRERFNVEASGQAVNRFSDDYYRHWPVELADKEVQSQGYLKSLTPAGELAVFLSIRGMCWRESKCYAEAAECFRAASRLAPECSEYRTLAAEFGQRK